MWLVRLFVKMEYMDPPVLWCHVQFLVRHRLCVQRHEVRDACYTVFFTKLLIKLAVMSFINPHLRRKLVVEIGLLLQCAHNVAYRAIFSNKNVERLLF